MRRRRKESLAETILDGMSRVPWWVGVTLAIALFLGLRMIASMEVEPATGERFGQSIGSQLFKTMAALGQWLFPPLFLIGAAISAFRQYRRRKPLDGSRLQPGSGTQAVPPGALSLPDAPTLHAMPPACPLCTSPMVERTAKKGPLAGKPFWGCSRHPACHGIRSHRPRDA